MPDTTITTAALAPTGRWSAVSATVLDRALELCRGDYQRAIVLGTEAISTSTLRGKAQCYSGRYKESSQALLTRLRAAGIPASVRVEARGRRVVTIGEV